MSLEKSKIQALKNKLSHWLFNSRLFSVVSGRKHLLCLGDSHVSIFTYMQKSSIDRRYFFEVLSVGGATSRGLMNPNSKSDALNKFRKRISNAKPWQHLLFQIGEVDCGFVIWHHAQENGLSVDSQLEKSLSNYIAFLDEIYGKGFHHLHVLSAPLPTIQDSQDWGEVATARSSIKATQSERTELTIRYNSKLAEMCSERGFGFIDISSELLDGDTGTIKKCFLNPNPLDHHLNEIEYSKVIIDRMSI